MTKFYTTRSGQRLTEADVERIHDEIDNELDHSTWVRVPVGRPPLEAGAEQHSPRIDVRVPATLHRRVRARAASDGRTVSQIVRALLEEYVRT